MAADALPLLTARGYSRRYYEQHRAAGLDYAVYSDWQRQYGRLLVEALSWRAAHLLDVGCACGSIAAGLEEGGAASCAGVDLCETMIALGRRNWPLLRLDICDAAHLHLYDDATFDGLHCAQVAEHWRPGLVPHILAELARVCRSGGLLFLCLDTTELLARQQRSDPLREDPTHLCLRPLDWWREQVAAAGWLDESAQACPAITTHALWPHFAAHDWDFLILRCRAQAGKSEAGTQL